MLEINVLLFTTIPMIALLCNLFLLFTLITAKKDSSIYAFMMLLVAFVLWTGGSLFMRMDMYPSVQFWWDISITGIFVVPYLYFLLAITYTEQRGFLLKLIWGIGTAIMVIANLLDAFIYNPHMNLIDGEEVFRYSVRTFAIVPVIFSVAIFISIWRLTRKALKNGDVPFKYIRPLLIGIMVMLIGVCLDTIPVLNTFPNDTLACAINAGLIYYAFYKKRIFALHQLTSKGGVYIVSLVVTGCILAPVCSVMEDFFTKYYSGYFSNSTIIIAVMCSAFAIAFFMFTNRLCTRLFVKEQNRKDDCIRGFSAAVNSSLKLDEILNLFYELVSEEINADNIYLVMHDDEKHIYTTDGFKGSIEACVEISEDNPLIRRLAEEKSGILYEDFKKSMVYRMMWEKEKYELEHINAGYVLPFNDDEEILGICIFAKKSSKVTFPYEETSFLESVASVANIAIKNAQLYMKMEKEARLDSLTGVYNRRSIMNYMEEMFEKKTVTPITLGIINLDDFSLYNELYGSEEGDIMLKKVAEILKITFGSRGIVSRYGGKEFAVLLPYTDSYTAKELCYQVRSELASRIDASNEKTRKFLTFSAGICSYPNMAVNLNQLVSYATMAVFQVKQNGKNQIAIFKTAMENQKNHEVRKGYMSGISSTIYALTAAIDAKDHYTFNHSQCVSKYATQLAEYAGLSPDHVEIIRQAGLLHDIGKIGIPDAILTKTGKLTDDEYDVMKEHVERSIEMIRHLPSLDYLIPAVIAHHERYDGKGYPRGIFGEDIPVGARCLSIADSFDAMISKRSYKDKMPLEEALDEILRNAGKQFDPDLAKMFVKLIRENGIEVIGY